MSLGKRRGAVVVVGVRCAALRLAVHMASVPPPRAVRATVRFPARADLFPPQRQHHLRASPGAVETGPCPGSPPERASLWRVTIPGVPLPGADQERWCRARPSGNISGASTLGRTRAAIAGSAAIVSGAHSYRAGFEALSQIVHARWDVIGVRVDSPTLHRKAQWSAVRFTRANL